MTIIYMILCKSTNDCYIGKTRNFEYVKREYKARIRGGYNKNIYKFIREHDGLDNFKFINLEDCSEEEAVERKQFYSRKFMPSLNKRIP